MRYGPIYNPTFPFGSQDAWLVGLELMITLVTGGSRGVALKSNCSLKKSCADIFGMDLAALSVFDAKNDWSIRRSHSKMGKSGSNEANPDLNYF